MIRIDKRNKIINFDKFTPLSSLLCELEILPDKEFYDFKLVQNETIEYKPIKHDDNFMRGMNPH